MKTESFVSPLPLTPPDPYVGAIEAARATLDEAERRAGIATEEREQARAALKGLERGQAEKAARDQKAAEEEAALKTAAERAVPLHARADELREGIRTALAWVAGALAERHRLNSQISALYPGKQTTSHIRVLSDVEPTKGRGSHTFKLNYELP